MEERGDGLVGVLHQRWICRARQIGFRRRPTQPDGRVAVVHQVREDHQRPGIQTRCVPRPVQAVVQRTHGRIHVHEEFVVAVNRTHAVVGIHQVGVHPVGRVARRHRRVGHDGHAVHRLLASAEIAAAVVLGGGCIVVARGRFRATLKFVHVADAVAIGVFGAVSTAHAHRVELVAVTIAFAGRNHAASTLEHGSRAIAHAAFVHVAHAVVCVVAHPVAVHVGRAVSAAHPKGIHHVPIAVASSCRRHVASAVEHRTRTVANAAGIKLANAVVRVVAHAVAIHVGGAVAATHAKGVKEVAVAVARTHRDTLTATHAALVHVFTRAVVGVGCVVVVACFFVDATPNHVFARAVVKFGLRVEVRRRRVRAPTSHVPGAANGAKRARPVKQEGHNLVVVSTRHGEDLGVDLAHDVARRGDLHHNHATVVVWQPVACRVQHVPRRTDERRRREASRTVGVEEGRDRLAGILRQHRVHRVGNVRGVLRLSQANRTIRIVGQFRVEIDEERVQPGGVPRPIHRVVVGAHRGVDHQVVHGVSKHRTQPVVVVDHVHIQTVTRQAFVHGRMSFHSQGVP